VLWLERITPISLTTAVEGLLIVKRLDISEDVSVGI
jgi:hypothetical protein